MRAEVFRAVRSVPFYVLLFIGAGLNALAVVGTASQLEKLPGPVHDLDVSQTLRLLGLGFGMSLFGMIYGALAVTRDFGSLAIRRQSLLAGGATTLLFQRLLLSIAPLAILGGVGLGATTLAVGLSLPGRGYHFAWSDDCSVVALGIVAVTVFAGCLGQLVAWQTRRSLVTVIGLVAWTLLLETYIIQLVPKVARFLPGGLTMAILKDHGSLDTVLNVAGGYLGYSVWIVVLALAAFLRLRRTDLA